MREIYHQGYSPRDGWLEGSAPEAYRALEEALGSRGRYFADERGRPYPDVVEALERYVDALSRADDWETRLSDFLTSLRKHPKGEDQFRALVRRGANPHYLAFLVDDYWRYAGARSSTAKAKQMRELLRCAATNLDRAASSYDSALAQLRLVPHERLRLDPRHCLPILEEAQRLRGRADAIDLRRRLSPRGTLVDLIQDHIVECSGHYHDKDVAGLLAAISRCHEFEWYAEKDLQERRSKRRPARALPGQYFQEIVTTEAQRRTREGVTGRQGRRQLVAQRRRTK